MKAQESGYENCWDYWRCSDDAKAKCPAFKAGAGKNCWIYTDNLKVFEWARSKVDFDTCPECPWYKQMNNKAVDA